MTDLDPVSDALEHGLDQKPIAPIRIGNKFGKTSHADPLVPRRGLVRYQVRPWVMEFVLYWIPRT